MLVFSYHHLLPGAYHGNTGISVFAGDPKFLSPFRLSYADAPHFVRVPFGDVAAALSAIDDQTAAVLMETIPATLGSSSSHLLSLSRIYIIIHSLIFFLQVPLS